MGPEAPFTYSPRYSPRGQTPAMVERSTYTPDPMDLGELTLETFEPCVGDVFAIVAEPASIELALKTAVALGTWPGGRQPFSLTFRGPRDPQLPQAIYRLEHVDLGALEIFIVPVGRDDRGVSYEAIFT